jgi:hypothetical protein
MVTVAGEVPDRDLRVRNLGLDQPLDLGGIHRHGNLLKSGWMAGPESTRSGGPNYGDLGPLTNTAPAALRQLLADHKFAC